MMNQRLHPAWVKSLLLLVVMWLAPALSAHAQNLSCSASGAVTFVIDPVLGTGYSTNTDLSYGCPSGSNSGKDLTVCFNIPLNGRAMTLTNGPQTLPFELYKDAARTQIWGAQPATNPSPATITMKDSDVPFSGRSLPLYATVSSAQNVPPGVYTGTISGTITFDSGSNCTKPAGSIALTATATVKASCVISAPSLVDLGTQPASATNITASSNISVTCPPNTSYHVGLQPSNGSHAGAGVMSSVSGSTDKVPYQLYQNSGMSTIWGTATTTGAGNGITGTGTGSAQTHTVYVRAQSADYQPGSYSDTVTISLYY